MKYAIVAILSIFLFCTMAIAAEELTVKASTIEFKTDKNGKQYCTIRFERQVTTGRLTYKESTLAMIPSWQTEALTAAKAIKPGQTITMAGNWNSYNGNDSFKVKALEAGAAVAKK
jgi:hypothetical protein